jgi:hypothetical protein
MPKTRVRNCHDGSRSDLCECSELDASGSVLFSEWAVRGVRLSLGPI